MVLADERRLEQNRLDLGIGEDDVEVVRLGHQPAMPVPQVVRQVVTEPLREPLGLADIEHAPWGSLNR
jgi:hypothetical protein